MARERSGDNQKSLGLKDFLRCFKALGGGVGEAAERCQVDFKGNQWRLTAPQWRGGFIDQADSSQQFYYAMKEGMSSVFARDMAKALIRQELIRRSIALAGGSSAWSQGEIAQGVDASYAEPGKEKQAQPLLDAAAEEGVKRAQGFWVALVEESLQSKLRRAALAAERALAAPEPESDAERQAARARFNQIDQARAEPSARSDSDLEAMRWLALKANGLELFEIDPLDESGASAREGAWRAAHQMLFNAKTLFDIPLLYEDERMERLDRSDGYGPYRWIEGGSENDRQTSAIFYNPMAAALWLRGQEKTMPAKIRGGFAALEIDDGGRRCGGHGSDVKEWSDSTIARLEAEMIRLAARPGAVLKKATL